MTGVAHTLAHYAASVRFEALPPQIRTHAAHAFFNWLGCVYGGCDANVVDATIGGLSLPSSGVALLGRQAVAAPVDAALVNCLSSSVHAFDDTHLATIIHPTGPVAAACHAVAAQRPVTGEAFYAALATGMEIECRLAQALLSGGASAGWLMTGVTGGIGAAVAASMLLRSDVEATAAAIGIAAAQGGGFRSAHGSMVMPLVPALAARNGLQAALWAQAGMTASDRLLEGANGLFELLAPGTEADRVTAGLGEAFLLTDNTFKPYPCGIVVHPVIDACIDLMRRRPIDTAEIARVAVAVHPIGKKLADRLFPEVEFEAQVSIQFCTAVALTCGQFRLEHLTERWLLDSGLRELQRRVEVTADPSLARDAATLEVVLASGERLAARVAHATGSRDNPMTVPDLVDKFRSQAEPVVGPVGTQELVELLVSGQPPAMDRLLALMGARPVPARRAEAGP